MTVEVRVEAGQVRLSSIIYSTVSYYNKIFLLLFFVLFCFVVSCDGTDLFGFSFIPLFIF